MVSLTLAVFSGIHPLSGAVFSGSTSSSTTDILRHEYTFTQKNSETTHLTITSSHELQDGLSLVETGEEVIAPLPTEALQSDLPEEEIVAMLSLQGRTSEPTPTPTSEPTPTSAPQPKADRPLGDTDTPTPQPKALARGQSTSGGDKVLADEATPIPTDTPTPTPPPAVTAPVDLDGLFSRFASEYSVDREQLKRIASCESHFNNDATNGDYVGMFQFAASSWSAVRSRMNADPNPDLRRNPEEAIKTAAFHISRGGQNAWPSCK